MKSKKIIAVVGGSSLLAAAFLLILCIKFVNMKESSPTGKYAGKTEKVEQTTTDKKEQKKPDWVEEKISGMTLEEKDDIELNRFLLETYDKFNLELPWKGDFDTFMSDKSNHLVFS